MNESPFSENYSPSELIDLYLDGVTNDSENSMLFDALSRNAELQSEFKGALALRTSAEYARESVVIPHETTAALFAKAGMTTGIMAGGATAFFGGIWAFIAAHAVKIAVPAASALAGGVLTYMLFMQQDNAVQATTGNGSTHTTITQQSLIQQQSADADKSAVLSQESGAQQAAGRELLPSASTSSGVIPPENHSRTELRRASPMRRAYSSLSAGDASTAATAAETSQPPASNLMHEEESAAAIVEYAPLKQHGFGNLVANGITASHVGQPAYFSGNAEPQWVASIVQHGGIANFPNRSASGSEPVLNNVSLAMMYALTPDHAIGVEAGQETFPIYLVREGNYEQKPVMTYVGAAYRFMPQSWEIVSGVRPFGQAVLGGAASGIVTKATLGLGWTPDRAITLTLGVEAMSLFYQFQGSSYGAQKLSLLYGAAINF